MVLQSKDLGSCFVPDVKPKNKDLVKALSIVKLALRPEQFNEVRTAKTVVDVFKILNSHYLSSDMTAISGIYARIFHIKMQKSMTARKHLCVVVDLFDDLAACREDFFNERLKCFFILNSLTPTYKIITTILTHQLGSDSVSYSSIKQALIADDEVNVM